MFPNYSFINKNFKVKLNYVYFNAICHFLNVISVQKEMNSLSQVTTDFAISVHCSRWERKSAGLYFHLRTEQNVRRCYWSSGDCVGPRCHQGVAPEVVDSLSNYTHVAYKQDALCRT